MAKLAQDTTMLAVEGNPHLTSESWDPSQSKRLERVVDALTDLYRNGTLNYELRPITLMNLGEDFARFYHAAFRREGRPQWATKAYPTGFQDLVSEINQRLEQEGVSILDTKRKVPPYKKLPQDQLTVVSALARLYAQGECNREEIVEELEAHSIKLSSTSFDRYFPRNLPQSEDRETANRHSAVTEITRRIEEVKKTLDFDLSIDTCLRGLIFESFVGAYLVELYGREAVKNQKKVPIGYRDLDGNPHSYVICDFSVHAQPVEVKLKNQFENIITSALAQAYAIEGLSGLPTKVSIICRTSCPFMLMAYHDNISIREEAEAMGLTDFRFVERKLQDVVTYQTIDEILAADPNGAAWKQRLVAIEKFLDTQSTTGLKKAARYLGHVANAPSETLTRLDIAIECLENNRDLSAHEQKRLLGGSGDLNTEDRKDFEAHIQFLIKRVNQSRETSALNLYNFTFGTKHESLTAVQLKELLDLDTARFNDACMDWLAAKEQARLDRITKHKAKNEEQSVIAAYERSRERHYKFRESEVVRHMKDLELEYTTLAKRRERAERYTDTFEIRQKSKNQFLRLLQENTAWPREKRKQQKIFDSASQNQNIQERARVRVSTFLREAMVGISQWNMMNHEDRMSESAVVNALANAVQDQMQKLSVDQAQIRNTRHYRFVEELDRNLARKISNPRERDRVLASDSHYSLKLEMEQMALDYLDLFLKVKRTAIDVDLPSSIIPILSLSHEAAGAEDPFNFAQLAHANLTAAVVNLGGNIELAFGSRGAMLGWAKEKSAQRPPLEKYIGNGENFIKVTVIENQPPEILVPFIRPHNALTYGNSDFAAQLEEPSPQTFSDLENAIESTREQLIAYLDAIKVYCAFSLNPDAAISLNTMKQGQFEMIRLSFPKNITDRRIKDGQKLVETTYKFGAQSHVLSNLLLCDYWTRKCGQARVLSFYSPAVAKDFFLRAHLVVKGDQDFGPFCELVRLASESADKEFEQLLYGSRGTTHSPNAS